MKQLILTICLLGCMAESQFTPEDNNTATRTASGNNQRECPNETCSVEMAEGEKILSDLSQSELLFLQTVTFKPQIAVRIPQILQKRTDYLNTYVKSPLRWLPRGTGSNMDKSMSEYQKAGYYEEFGALPQAYVDGAGNNAHLAITPPIQMPWIKDKTALYYPVVSITEKMTGARHGSTTFANARLTYDAIDYFANAKCPATITGKDGYARDDGHFKATFPNGNEITVSAKGTRGTISMRNVNFWVGQDKNLKMVYKNERSLEERAYKLKFATFAECGVRMPEHDYECKIDYSKRTQDDPDNWGDSTCP